MISPFSLAAAALGGLIAGSFLNVCIHRLPRRESVVAPGSRCPGCGVPLRWFDNIPVVSWVALGGRCRRCRTPISLRYPLVEVTAMLAAVAIVLLTPPGVLLVSRLLFAALLIALFVIDLEHQILPNVLTVPGIAAGFLLSTVAPPGPASSAIGIGLGAGVLYGIAAGYYLVRREEGMGMGDVKMLAMIGAFLGWPAVVLTLVLSSLSGAVIGIVLMAARGADMRYAMPFGTFLAIAAFIAMLAGDPIITWYLGRL